MPSGWRGWRAGNHEHADGVPFRYAAGCSPGLKVRLVLPLLRTFAIGLSICLFSPLARAEGDNERPIATIVLTSTGHDLRSLSTMTEQIISKRFQSVAGVGQVKLRGLRARQCALRAR